MKIKDYKVLIASGTTDAEGTTKITEIVKQHLKSGWSLQGGTTSLVTNMNYLTFIQTVIMYED